MSFVDRRHDPNRVRFAIMAAAIHAVLGVALIIGLGVDMPPKVAETLTLVALRPAAPPKEAPPAPARSPTKAREDSPRNLKAEPKPIVAPPPKIEVPPPPVVAAPAAGQGAAATAGASDLSGPGFGGGGQGNGAGYGGGDGDGEGMTPSRRIAGKIRASDYPREAREAGIGGTTYVRYTVGVAGRVTDCEVTESSGSDILDSATCRLIIERFRFEPARDPSGRPIPDQWVGENSWRR